MALVLPACDPPGDDAVGQIGREACGLRGNQQPAVVRRRIADRRSLHRVIERTSAGQLAKRLALDLCERRSVNREAAACRQAQRENRQDVVVARYAASVGDEGAR